MDTTSSGLGPAARAEREAYLSGRTSDPEEQSNEGVSKSEIIAPTRVTHFRGPDGNLIKIKAPSGDGYLLKHSGQKHPVDPKTGDPVLISEDGTTSSIYDKAPTIKKDGVIYSAPPGYRQKAIGKDPDWNPNAPSTKEEQKAQATKAKEDAKNAKAIIDDNLARVTNIVSQIDADNQLKTIATKKDEAIAKAAEDEASQAVTESSAKLKALQSDKDSGAVDQQVVDAAAADLEAKKQVAKKLASNASAISARGIEEDFKRATQKVVMGQNLEQVKLMTTSRRAALTMPSATKTAPDAEKPAPAPSAAISALPATGPVKQAEAVVKAPDIKNLSQPQSGFNSPFPHITREKKDGGSVFDTPELPELNLPSYGEARHGNIKPAFFHAVKSATNTHFIEDGKDAPADEMGFKEQGESKTTRRTPAQKAADDATPASWLTPEATAAREAAKATGTDLIHADETLKVTLPELGKDDKKGGVWVDGQQVGDIVHNDLGLPEVVLSQKVGGVTASPSYRSQNPFSGVPEYAAPSAQHIETATTAADKDPNGQDPAMVKGTIDKTWKARRMEEDEFSALVENWKGAGEYERRKLMSAGVLKEMDKEMPDARLLYKQGVISLQQARTLDQAVYGRNPILPAPDASYEAWKAGDTDAAKRLREYEVTPVGSRRLLAARDELFTEWRNEYRNRHSDQPDFDPHAFNDAADKISGGQSTLAQRFWSGVSETGSNVTGSMLGMGATVVSAGRTIGYILNQAAEDAGVFEEGTVKQEFLGDPLDKAEVAAAKSKMMAGEKLSKEDLIILWQDEFAMGRKAAPNVLQAVFTPQTLKLTVETGIQQAKNLFSGLWMGRDSDPRKTMITGPVAPVLATGGGFGGGGMRGFQTEAEKKAAVDKYMSERMLPGSPVGYTVDALIDAIEDENLTKGTIDQFAELLKNKAGSMHKITEGETESLAAIKKLNPQLTDAEIKAHYDNQKSGKLQYYDIRNKQAPVAQLMVAYHETRDPAIAMLLREAFYQTPEGQENVAKAARYASVNGTIKNSDAYAVLDMSARGISVNPGEFTVEAAGDIVGYSFLKGLTSSQIVLRAAGKSAKLAKNVGRAANSANKIIDSVMKGMDELGTIAKQAGTVPGSTVRNAAVQTAKGLGVGTVTEGMEGVGSGLMNEARSTEKIWNDAVQEGMGGLFASFIGGSAAIVSSIFDAAKQKDAIRKGEMGFVNFWNKQNPQTPIELDDVRGIMSFINPAERQQHDKDVMELAQKYFAEKDQGVATPQTETAFIEAIGRRNRAIQLAYEAHTELGGVGDQKMKDFITASMKVLTGQPLTQRDQLAMEATDASGAPLAVKDGSEVTWTKEGLAQVAQATPGLRQTYFPRDVEQQEADREAKKAQAEAQAKADAEAKAKTRETTPADRESEIRKRLAEIESDWGPRDEAKIGPDGTITTTQRRITSKEEEILLKELEDLGQPPSSATNPNGETGNSSDSKSEGDGSIPSSGSAPAPSSTTRTEEDFANPDENYRIVTGDAAFEDIVKSGLVRTNADQKQGTGGTLQEKIGNRPTAFPSFAKGAAAMHYARQNPNHYIITTTDPSLQPSKSGRHSKGKTMFPTDAAGNHQTSLDAKNVDVWKHVGEGKYELVYSKGQVVTPQAKAKTEAAPAPTQSALAHPVFNGISDKAKAREANLNSRGVQTVTVKNDKEAADFIGADLKNKGRSAFVAIKDGKPVVVFISDNISKIKKTPESMEQMVNEEMHHAAALLVIQENQETMKQAEKEAEGINGESFYKGYSKLSARAKAIEAMAAYADGRWTPGAKSAIRKIVDLIVSSIVQTGISLAESRTAAIGALKSMSEAATALLDGTVDDAAHEAATSPNNNKPQPTQAQKDAGNYPVGKINIAGIKISIENPVGSTRSGTSKKGKKWSTTMKAHYGYMRGTIGHDGDQVDVFVKEGTPENFSGDAFIIPQFNPETNKFDEHKVMIGYSSIDEAKKAYKEHYEKGWTGYRPAQKVSMDRLAEMVKSGSLNKPNPRTRTNTNEQAPQTTPVGNTPGTGQTDSTTTDNVKPDEQQPAPSTGSDVGPKSGPADEQSKRPAPESKKAVPQWTIRTTRGRTLTIPADQAKDKQEAINALAKETVRGEMLLTYTLTQPDESGSDKTVVQQVYEVIANLIKGKHKDDAKFYASLGTMIAVALKKHMPTLEASFDKIVVLDQEVEHGGMYVQGDTLYIAPRTFIKSLAALPAKDMQEFVDRGFFHEYLHTVIDSVVSPEEAGKFWRGLTEQAQDEFRAAYSQGKKDIKFSDTQWGNEFLRAYLENRFGKGISEEMFLGTKFFRNAVDLIKRIIDRLTNIMESISDEADKNWMAEKISEINAAFVASQQNITSGNVDAQRAAKVAKARAKPIGSSSLVKAHVNDNFGAMLKEIGVDLVPSFSSVSAHYVVSEGGKRRGGYIEYNPMTMAEWSPGQITDAMREEMIHALEDKALIAEMMKQGHKMTDKYIQSGQYHMDFFDGIYGMMTPEQIKYVKSIYTSHGNRKYVIGSEFRRMVMQKEHYNGLTEQAMAGNKTPAKRNAALEAVASLFSAAVSTLKKMMFKNTQAGKQAKKVYDAAIADLRRIDPRGEAKDLGSTIQPMAGPATNDLRINDAGSIITNEQSKQNLSILTSATSNLTDLGFGGFKAAPTHGDIFKALTKAGVKEVESVRDIDPDSVQIQGGFEHFVWTSDITGSTRAIKVLKKGNRKLDSSVTDYLTRFIISNQLLSDDIRLEGVTKTGSIFISQPWIDGPPGYPTQSQVWSHMVNAGWAIDRHLNTVYHSPDGRLIIEDTHNGNFVVDHEGRLWPIDSTFTTKEMLDYENERDEMIEIYGEDWRPQSLTEFWRGINSPTDLGFSIQPMSAPAGPMSDPATLSDFDTPESIKEIINKPGWAIFTAENPNKKRESDLRNAILNRGLMKDLDSDTMDYRQVDGHYGYPEKPFIVIDQGMSVQKAAALARKYGQESVLTTEGLVYPDGSYNPAQDVTIFDKKPDDNYTVVKTPTGNVIFSVNMDWDNKIQPMAAPASQTAPALAEIDRILDLPKRMPSVVTSRLEGGKVRTIAQIYRKLIKTSIRPGGNVNNAGDRMLEVLNRASFEFPKFASWYESRLKMAMNIFTQLDPDLIKPDNRAALLITLAVSSNGADVNTQTVDAWEVYKHWKKSGKLAGATKRGSTRAEAVEEHLALADKMAEHLGGFSNLGDFLNRTGTVKELRNELRKMHLWDKKEILGITTGELIDEIVPFSLIFGPKLGSFFNNMSGDFSTITMDRWFMRTIGRMMGTQLVRVDKGTLTKAWSRLNAALAEYDGDLFTIAGIPQKADLLTVETLGKHFQKKENRENLSPKDDAIRLAVNGLFKIADGFTLAEAPKNGTHRRWIRKVMINAIDKYNQTAKIPLVPAEAQALLWYYEKIVHQQHGSRQKDDAPDYGSAANRLYIKERGLPSSLYEDSDGIKPRSGGGRSAAFSGNQSVSTSQGSGDGTNRGDVVQPMAGPAAPTDADAIAALSSDKRNYFGKARNLPEGKRVGIRIDIPAFERHGVYVITVHEAKRGVSVGDRIGYDTFARVSNPLFHSNEKGALMVKEGTSKKFPLATVEGDYIPSREIPDVTGWTDVGYNPKRHSYFYDKSTGNPVLGGSEGLSIGNSVFVKDAVFGDAKDFLFMAGPNSDPASMASGIASKEDAKMVMNAVAEWENRQQLSSQARSEYKQAWNDWQKALSDAGPWYNKEHSEERNKFLNATDSTRARLNHIEELRSIGHQPINGVYLRFGKIPEGGRSTNGYTGRKEMGVSVYNIRVQNGRWSIVDDGSGGATQESILDDANRSILLVTGDEVDQGSDDEPVLSNVRVLKELQPNEIVPANWDEENWDEESSKWNPQYMAAPQRSNIVEPGFYSYLQNVIAEQLPDTLATKPGKTVRGRPIAERTITDRTGKVLKVIRAGQEPDKVYPAQTVASQVQEIMEKADVTKEEIKWSGIIPWLSSKESVTKEEVLDYLKTEGNSRFVEKKLIERSRSFRDYMDIIQDRMTLAGNYSKFEEDKKFIEERLDTWMSKGDAESIKYLQMITDLDIDEINPPGDGEAGYPQEALRTSGGRNYREVIVTTPGQNEVTLKKGFEIKQMDSGRWNIWDSSTKGDGPGWVLTVGKDTRDAVVAFARRDEMLAAENQQQFTSSHYPDIPNYIAHMRIQDFEDGLLIDELQSDREKETRKKGLREDGALEKGNPNGIPDAPFRRSAQWSMQLFKRALRDAVANGKEWVGWTTGAVQNKRSGLEKIISEVKMTKAFGGRDGRYYLTAYDHNFKRVIDTIIQPEELAKNIGNELAEKMNAMEWTTGKVEQSNGAVTEETFKKLKGLDVKVGGKGMTDLYDKIVPTEVNEYLKQWGVKAEPSEVTSTSGLTYNHHLNILGASNFSVKSNINNSGKFGVWDYNLRRLVLDGVGEDGGDPILFDTKKDAEQWIVNGEREKIKIPVWKVQITPEMRESIKSEGQPLFMAGPRHESPDAAESFLEQMMGELPSEAELEALRQMALSQKPGEKTIGDPDKANISKNEKIRVEYEVSQQIRSGDVSPEKVQDWLDQGRKMARNEDDVMNQVMSSYFEGGGFDSPELVFASAIVTARKFRRALQSGDPAQMREAHAMAYADGAGRSQTARAMRAMADPHKSPHERNMEYIAKLITTPSIRERIEIAAAPSPFAKQKQIAKLKAKLAEVKALLAESEKSRVRGKTHDDLIKQTKALTEEIKTQSEEKDRKTLIEEYTESRHKAVMDALAAQGISEEDIFVTPEERVNSHDSEPVREAMGMHPQEHQDAIRYIMRGYSHADVAVMTGLPRDVINTIHQDFRQKSLRGTIAKWVKRGNTLFDTIQSGIKYITGQSMAAPMPYNTAINNKVINAEVEIERQLNVLCPTAKQVNSGKMIVEIVDSKKNGQQVTIKVPYSPTDFRATYRVARAISIAQSSAYDKMYEYWIMNLLSGPETNVVNVIGNILSSGIHILAQKPLETLWNIIFKDPNSAQMGEWKHIMRGIMPGIRDAFAMAALAFDSEADPIGHRYMDEPLELSFDKAGQLDKVGRYRGPSIAGTKGRIFRLPGRSLMMVDSFMKALMGNIEVGAQAYRLGKQAQKAGLIGNSAADIESFIKAEVSTPGSKSWELAIDVATELAFQSETWMSAVARAFAQPNLGADQYQKKALDAAAAGNIKKMHDMRRAANAMMFIEHAMRFIFPFVRTPTNILRIGIRKSPIGSISLAAHVMMAFGKGASNIKNKKRFWANQERATIVTLMAEQTQAWLTLATVFSMTEGDDDDDDKKLIIVGGRPSGTTSPGSRNEAYRNYGGTYMIIYRHDNGKETRVPFGRYDPIATVLGTTVDSIIEIKRMHKMRSLGLDGGSAMNATTNIIGSLMSQTEDKSFFQGYSNMVKTVDSLRRAGDAPSDLAYGFLKQIISGVVPNLLRQPLRNADPLVRDSKDKAELLYSALPLGIWAGPVVDYYGREVEKGGSPVSRIFIRAGNKATTREPAEEWITEWNNLHPDDKFQPTDLRANDYWVYGPKGERRMITDNSVKTTFEKAVGQEILRMHNNYVSGLKKSPGGKIISGKDNNVDLKNKLTNLASEAKKAVRTRFLKSPFASARNTID